jgi:hypothetical protein
MRQDSRHLTRTQTSAAQLREKFDVIGVSPDPRKYCDGPACFCSKLAVSSDFKPIGNKSVNLASMAVKRRDGSRLVAAEESKSRCPDSSVRDSAVSSCRYWERPFAAEQLIRRHQFTVTG